MGLDDILIPVRYRYRSQYRSDASDTGTVLILILSCESQSEAYVHRQYVADTRKYTTDADIYQSRYRTGTGTGTVVSACHCHINTTENENLGHDIGIIERSDNQNCAIRELGGDSHRGAIRSRS
jgi:hypothetical protein